jgi:hypothetical protein
MPREARTLTAADLIPLDRFAAVRADKKAEAIVGKRLTRVHVGPHATAIFETWDSMWLQVQEMLRIEKGGEAQVADEIAAYAPMVPNGRELTATLLFEVEDPVRRDAFLRTIGGVEDRIFLELGGERIAARAEGDVERTRASDGKASAVHFVHFDFTPEQIARWKGGAGQAMLVIDHPNYGHAALIGPETRAFLAEHCFD